jgi:YD repeat-containing protein
MGHEMPLASRDQSLIVARVWRMFGGKWERVMNRMNGRILGAFMCALLELATPAARAGTISYVYDALGRLISATYPSGVITVYTYDAAGNRTAYSTTASPPPVVGPVSAAVAYNSTANPISPNVSGYYTSVAVSAPATHGTASASGVALSYTPNTGYTGADSFGYTASNGGGTSAPAATVSITVTSGLVPPVVNPVSATVAFNSSGNNIPLSVSGTYTSVAVSTPAGHGIATASGVTISYSPNTGYSGADSFNYTASNSAGTSSPAAIASITINPGLSVTIASGASASGASDSHTFGANTASVTGGSGAYTYIWTPSSMSATWTSGTSVTFAPAVSGVDSSIGCYSTAGYTVTVTDTVSGHQATSNTATYSWRNTSSSCGN